MPTSPAEPGAGFWRTNFPAFSEAAIRRYLAGQFFSYGSGVAQAVGLNLLIYELTASAWLVGVVNFLLFGPMLLIAPLTGGRLSQASVKVILLSVLAANMVTSSILWWCVASRQEHVPLLLALALANGVLSAIELPSRLILIPASLSNPKVASSAFSLNILVNNFSRMVGAPAGALLFDAWRAGPFALNVAGSFAMMACVASISIRSARGELPGRARGLLDGVRYARADSFASFFLPAIGAVALFAGSYVTLVPLLAAAEFGNTSQYTGLFLGAAGAGSVLASVLLSSRWGAAPGARFIHANQWASCLCLALAAVPLGVAGALIAFCVLGWSLTFANAASCAAMLQRCPEDMRGPVAGLYAMAYAGLPPFGHVLAGALSTRFGVRATLIIMTTGLAVSLLGICWLHSRRPSIDAGRFW